MCTVGVLSWAGRFASAGQKAGRVSELEQLVFEGIEDGLSISGEFISYKKDPKSADVPLFHKDPDTYKKDLIEKSHNMSAHVRDKLGEFLLKVTGLSDQAFANFELEKFKDGLYGWYAKLVSDTAPNTVLDEAVMTRAFERALWASWIDYQDRQGGVNFGAIILRRLNNLGIAQEAIGKKFGDWDGNPNGAMLVITPDERAKTIQWAKTSYPEAFTNWEPPMYQHIDGRTYIVNPRPSHR